MLVAHSGAAKKFQKRTDSQGTVHNTKTEKAA
jgi:hypothetical protein